MTSDLRARLAHHDAATVQFAIAAAWFGQERRGAALNRWCDLLRSRRHHGAPNSDETMADLLAAGVVSEDDLRFCFHDAA